MATIKDVAKLAGVSTATVSRVINKAVHVEPVTLERVNKAIKKLNYKRDIHALNLSSRKNNLLGLLTGNLSDPFFAIIAKSVEKVARDNNSQLLLISGDHDPIKEKNGLDFLIEQGCEAIIVHSKMLSDETILRYSSELPSMIMLNRVIPQISNRCVWIDQKKSSIIAINHLISLGHKKIAYVTCKLSIEDKNQRLAGYIEAMDNANLPIKSNWIIHQDFSEEGGGEAALAILNQCADVTAIATFNDLMAAGLIASLQEHNIKIPNDISVIGFDDILLARYIYPRLSTIHNPIDKMAECAAKLAINSRDGQNFKPHLNIFTASLVHRQTSKTTE